MSIQSQNHREAARAAKLLRDAADNIIRAAEIMAKSTEQEPAKSEYMTSSAAARYMGRSPSYVTRLVQAGRLARSDVGIRRKDVEALCAPQPISNKKHNLHPSPAKRGMYEMRVR